MPIISMIQRVADPLSHPVLFPIDHGQRFVINHRSAVSPPPSPVSLINLVRPTSIRRWTITTTFGCSWKVVGDNNDEGWARGGMLYGQVRQAALPKLSPISRWNPGRNSLTIQLQLGIPGSRTLSWESLAVWQGEGGDPHFSKCYADFCLAGH